MTKELDLQVEGLSNVPSEGPVLLAARHYHHLYDGCAIFAAVPRQVQVLVGLDWLERPMALVAMQRACRAAGWPVVFRDTAQRDRAVWLPMLRAARQQSIEILRAGRMLLVFPEGYPTIDPHGSKKTGDDEFLPFQAGFAHIALDAWKAGIPAPLIPVGFHYRPGDPWQATLRFGQAIAPAPGVSAARLAAEVQERVVALSAATRPLIRV